jgi:hypothetical protein
MDMSVTSQSIATLGSTPAPGAFIGIMNMHYISRSFMCFPHALEAEFLCLHTYIKSRFCNPLPFYNLYLTEHNDYYHHYYLYYQ